MNKPKFSILSMLLIVTLIGLGLALFLTQKKTRVLEAQNSAQEKLLTYFKDETGYIDHEDDGRLYIRELESHVPLARKYYINFPSGNYHLVAGNFLGGELKPENVQRHAVSNLRLRLNSILVIHLFQEPNREVGFYSKRVDFSSGEVGGGYLKHKVNIGKASQGMERHDEAIGWRIGNEKPHGEAKVYPPDFEFIPLFVFEDVISLSDDDGNPVESKGIAFWIEPKTKGNRKTE